MFRHEKTLPPLLFMRNSFVKLGHKPMLELGSTIWLLCDHPGPTHLVQNMGKPMKRKTCPAARYCAFLVHEWTRLKQLVELQVLLARKYLCIGIYNHFG